MEEIKSSVNILRGQSDGGNPSTDTPASQSCQADNKSRPYNQVFNFSHFTAFSETLFWFLCLVD